jgi:hypothetical protein
MVARRLGLSVLACVSTLACLLANGVGSAAAATPFEFGTVGSEAGQFSLPAGVATDASGDVYVGDAENNRVDKFDKSGHFELAWGAGVVNGANELQTCTTECGHGHQSPVTGGFEFATGVAVDASGDVYVVDKSHARVEKFGPEGEFLLMFGGHVNKNGENICRKAEETECQAGQPGTADGEFSLWETFGSFIATGPGSKVYVGDKGRVEIFEPSGAWKENISLAGLSSGGSPTALAVDSAGDVFVKDEGVEGVHELEPSGLEALTQFDKESTSVTALAVDPASGDLFVGDEAGGFHVLKYDPAGTERASFGSNTLSGLNRGIAFSDATAELYASEAAEEEGKQTKAGVWALTPPPAGPLIERESVEPFPKGKATLTAQVNPEGNETTYHFEYVDQGHFQESGYASATSTAPVSITEELFDDQVVRVELPEGTLIPGETYHWRVVATDSLNQTTTGADQSFEETPSALMEGPWTEDVADTSATMAARINPLGANTEYRLEYGRSTPYQHVLSGSLGAGEAYVPVSRHVQELEPGTTYHYRFVMTSEVGIVKGADRTFTTQPAGVSQLVLPDERAWELVSPPSKNGSVIALFTSGIQAATDGSRITYGTQGPPAGESVTSNTGENSPVLSTRSSGGWQSQNIEVPENAPEPENGAPSKSSGVAYRLFSQDLARAALPSPQSTSFSPEALEGTLYLRNIVTGSYTPLLTPANTPSGTELMLEDEFQPGLVRDEAQVGFLAGTPDLAHIVLGSPLKLTEEAVAQPGPLQSDVGNLYQWSGGRLQLVDILPDNEPVTQLPGQSSVELAGEADGLGEVARAVSSDGRWIAWTLGRPYGEAKTYDFSSYKGLFLRDTVAQKTVRLGGGHALYQTMTSDGSHIFFLEAGDLYEYDTATGTQTDLTGNHGASESSAGVQEAVSDVSKDGTYVYFVAKGALAKGATDGEDNLYLLHNSGGVWSTTYITTLSPNDEQSWLGRTKFGTRFLVLLTSRISPNGRYLAFMSERSLTGYDNIDVNSPAGEPRHDAEVYLYDASTGRLACASCKPSGARPVGVLAKEAPVLNSAWAYEGTHWLAGSIPGWQGSQGGAGDGVYQPRYLSDSGRLFFNSSDALVSQDTNQLEDVYQYEPAGVGGCTPASATFSERSGACVNLISSGTSSSESVFMDASENGDDIFFLTASRLTTADFDTEFDVYDAHLCATATPCVLAPSAPPPCTSGDSCKPAPATQPELFGAAPSATFSGAGNLTPAPTPASKPLTRAEKLAKALAACRKKHKRRLRRACERTARKRYGHAAKRLRKLNATKRDGK